MNSKEEGKVDQNLGIKQKENRIHNTKFFLKSNRDLILPAPDNSFLLHLTARSYKYDPRKTKSIEEAGGIKGLITSLPPERFSGASEDAEGLEQHAHTENVYTS